MASSNQSRPDIRKFFQDNDIFSRANAENWLSSLGYSNLDSNDALNDLFADNKIYNSSTLFIQDLEAKLSEKWTSGDNMLSAAELDSVFGNNNNTDTHTHSGTAYSDTYSDVEISSPQVSTQSIDEIDNILTDESSSQPDSSPSTNSDITHTNTESTNGTVPEMEYEYLKDESGTIDTKNADYVMVIRSAGRDQKEIDENYFGTTGGTVIGQTGSKDKAMQLLDTSNVDSIKFDKKVQIIRIYTDGKELKVDNAMNNNNSMSGALDPELGNSENSIKKDTGSDFAIYADDESKYDERVKTLSAATDTTFFSGDDSAYVMTSEKAAKPRGNGAIMQLSFV